MEPSLALELKLELGLELALALVQIQVQVQVQMQELIQMLEGMQLRMLRHQRGPGERPAAALAHQSWQPHLRLLLRTGAGLARVAAAA